MKTLEHLLKLKERDLKIELYNYLLAQNMSPVFEDGFLYAKGDIPILLVAHIDTVFDEPPKELIYDKFNDMIFSFSGGIGGDDRCGVYAIVEILKKYKPHVLFTEDEEIGLIGAYKAIEKLDKPDVKYIIEIDRRGNKDCVFYNCYNKDFINYIESFGFVTDFGSYSDISVLGEQWGIAAVNLSSGYYNEHTDQEYIVFSELQGTIKKIKSMLKSYKKAPYFDYQSAIFSNFDDKYQDRLWSNDKWLELAWFTHSNQEKGKQKKKKEKDIDWGDK